MKENSSSDNIPKDNLNEKLIHFNNQKHKTSNNRPTYFQELINKIFPCLNHVDQLSKKYVFLKESELNYTYFSNKVENNKYNLISFIPVVIFNQFKQFGNFFYLVMTLTQLFPPLVVGFLFSYLSPLVIVVGFTMLKELYDDINRRYQDRITNNEIYTIYKNNDNNEPEEISITSAELKIGDFIIINENQRVPADIILLKTINNDSDDNHAFIRTDQLDGETDWKLRKALGYTQKLSISQIINLDGFMEYEAPSKLIYNFEGVFECKIDNNNIIKEPLSLENTIWSSTVLASKKAFGIVCYTGNETRVRMNSSEPKIKIGILDDELNKINVYLFFIMCILSFIITFMKFLIYNVFSTNLFFIFFRFIVLFCGIIPISLRVNLDVSKTYFSLMINRDDSIKDTIARNSTIPEELGRITYVFTDKTGTLTKNEMIFKKIAMEIDQFTEESFSELNLILDDECKKSDAPLVDLINNNNNSISSINNTDLSYNTISTDSLKKDSDNREERKGKKNRRQRTKVIRDTITSMVLCNNVTPIQDKDNPDLYTYQASSPDEVALVKFSESLNMRLIYRSDSEIHIKNKANVIEEYEILANFPFSSDTKRMGIILKNKKYGHIIFYLKGAENVMTEYVKEEYKGYIKENAESLATKGLRTLVLTERIISQNEFDKWNEEYNEAITSMEHRKEKVAQAISKLENNMDFLCVTGVEDLLQDRVNATIENLRNAGMKIWMLTGDKIETAICISISCGLKAKNHTIFSIKYDDFEHEDKDEDVKKLKEKFTYYKNLSSGNPHIFIIDGDTLDLALKNAEKEFFETAMKAPSVVCCRCSPTQKRIIVKTIKKYTDKRTAAVGDGGNDVAMIQEADVGIGIVGKEGLQASLAADYSILEFNYLDTLLLWWGRLAYKNTSQMSNFIIHRGLIISLIQFIFSCIFYFNSVALYNGMLIMGYSTIYTCFPSISVLLDQDTDKKNVMKFPGLYKNLLMGRELNLKIFLWWFFKSIYQAVVIMFGALYFFQENLFLIIVTITFTCLIFLEILNVYTEINKFHKFMVVSLIGTGFCYLISIYLLPNLLNTAYIWNFTFFWKIGLISIISWSPFYIANRIKKFCFPETIEKLNAIGKDI